MIDNDKDDDSAKSSLDANAQAAGMNDIDALKEAFKEQIRRNAEGASLSPDTNNPSK